MQGCSIRHTQDKVNKFFLMCLMARYRILFQESARQAKDLVMSAMEHAPVVQTVPGDLSSAIRLVWNFVPED